MSDIERRHRPLPDTTNVAGRPKSSPAFAGEGDHPKDGGGAAAEPLFFGRRRRSSLRSRPSTTLRVVPLPSKTRGGWCLAPATALQARSPRFILPCLCRGGGPSAGWWRGSGGAAVLPAP